MSHFESYPSTQEPRLSFPSLLFTMADELDKLTGDDILSTSMEMTEEITHYVPRSYHPVPIGDILIREFLQKRRRSYVAIFGFASVACPSLHIDAPIISICVDTRWSDIQATAAKPKLAT
ncbi:hypothetical protein M422DRAFT_246211 [Sphaerobolus stellatus SS14]|nr:hypothetical protein M422DRAFT_246211 [Sphaerobolus stellatus SS14]